MPLGTKHSVVNLVLRKSVSLMDEGALFPQQNLELCSTHNSAPYLSYVQAAALDQGVGPLLIVFRTKRFVDDPTNLTWQSILATMFTDSLHHRVGKAVVRLAGVATPTNG